MSKKPLSSLELSELLAELETSSDLKQFRTDGVEGDVLTFFNAFDLRPGNDTIPTKVLYKIYKAWSKTPVSPRPFIYQTHEVFNYNSKNILINEELFKVKREDWVYFYTNPKVRGGDKRNSKRHFDAFLKHFDLSQGTEPINFESLVLLYTRFLNEINRKSPLMSRQKLTEFCKLYFKEKITANGNYYFVSDSIWNSLNREVYNEKEKEAKISKKHKKISISNS